MELAIKHDEALYYLNVILIMITTWRWIIQIRLKRAVQLLKKNQMYISEVAYKTVFKGYDYNKKDLVP